MYYKIYYGNEEITNIFDVKISYMHDFLSLPSNKLVFTCVSENDGLSEAKNNHEQIEIRARFTNYGTYTTVGYFYVCDIEENKTFTYTCYDIFYIMGTKKLEVPKGYGGMASTSYEQRASITYMARLKLCEIFSYIWNEKAVDDIPISEFLMEKYFNLPSSYDSNTWSFPFYFDKDMTLRDALLNTAFQIKCYPIIGFDEKVNFESFDNLDFGDYTTLTASQIVERSIKKSDSNYTAVGLDTLVPCDTTFWSDNDELNEYKQGIRVKKDNYNSASYGDVLVSHGTSSVAMGDVLSDPQWVASDGTSYQITSVSVSNDYNRIFTCGDVTLKKTGTTTWSDNLSLVGFELKNNTYGDEFPQGALTGKSVTMYGVDKDFVSYYLPIIYRLYLCSDETVVKLLPPSNIDFMCGKFYKLYDDADTLYLCTQCDIGTDGLYTLTLKRLPTVYDTTVRLWDSHSVVDEQIISFGNNYPLNYNYDVYCDFNQGVFISNGNVSCGDSETKEIVCIAERNRATSNTVTKTGTSNYFTITDSGSDDVTVTGRTSSTATSSYASWTIPSTLQTATTYKVFVKVITKGTTYTDVLRFLVGSSTYTEVDVSNITSGDWLEIGAFTADSLTYLRWLPYHAVGYTLGVVKFVPTDNINICWGRSDGSDYFGYESKSGSAIVLPTTTKNGWKDDEGNTYSSGASLTCSKDTIFYEF